MGRSVTFPISIIGNIAISMHGPPELPSCQAGPAAARDYFSPYPLRFNSAKAASPTDPLVSKRYALLSRLYNPISWNLLSHAWQPRQFLASWPPLGDAPVPQMD